MSWAKETWTLDALYTLVFLGLKLWHYILSLICYIFYKFIILGVILVFSLKAGNEFLHPLVARTD